MVKSMGPVMALVAFLERLVMTVLEEAITNDQFLAFTSVSIVTAWRLFFRLVRDVQTLENLPSARGKVKIIKTRHR